MDIKCGIKGVRKVLWTVTDSLPQFPVVSKDWNLPNSGCLFPTVHINHILWLLSLALALLVVSRSSDGQCTLGQSSMVSYGIQLPHKRRTGTGKSTNTACWCLADLQPTTWSPCRPRFLEWSRSNWWYYFVGWHGLLTSIPAAMRDCFGSTLADQPHRFHVQFHPSYSGEFMHSCQSRQTSYPLLCPKALAMNRLLSFKWWRLR